MDRIVAGWVVLALALLLLLVIFVPRPDVRLTSVRIETSACDRVASTSSATAYFALTNIGTGDGDVEVRLWVDGQIRASQSFGVAAGTSVNRTLSASIPDCSSHAYRVDTILPSG